jgi:putative DNA primase/helicase
LAEETNVAFSAITHPPKASGQRAIDQFIGSRAFIAAGRIGHMCINEVDEENKETGRVLYTHAKHNSSERMPTLAYRVEVVPVGQSEKGVIVAPRVAWAAEPVNLTANEALEASRAKPDDSAQGQLKKFILDLLKDGPMLRNDVEKAAKNEGFSEKQIRTAREKLKLVSWKTDREGYWGLPNTKPEEMKKAGQSDLPF